MSRRFDIGTVHNGESQVGDKSKVKPKAEPRRVGARNMSGGSSRKQISVPNNGCFYECGELISEETRALAYSGKAVNVRKRFSPVYVFRVFSNVLMR